MINKGLSKVGLYFLYLLSLLPLGILYLLSDFIYLILYRVLGYRKKVVRVNLQNSFPLKTKEELLQIEKDYFHYLADLMVETIKMLSASAAYLHARYSFTNYELIRPFEEEKKSILIAVGHYGNWEWSTIVIPLAIKFQALIIYKPLQNEVFDNAFKKAREKGGTKMIKMLLTLKEIIRHKHELTATVFAADQTPARTEGLLWIDFLNQSTPVFLGLEKIAKSTNYPVVFCDMQRVKRGYYSCDFKLVSADPSKTNHLDITKKQFELLENRINIEPRYWLWSHKRWKHKFEEHDERA